MLPRARSRRPPPPSALPSTPLPSLPRPLRASVIARTAASAPEEQGDTSDGARIPQHSKPAHKTHSAPSRHCCRGRAKDVHGFPLWTPRIRRLEPGAIAAVHVSWPSSSTLPGDEECTHCKGRGVITASIRHHLELQSNNGEKGKSLLHLGFAASTRRRCTRSLPNDFRLQDGPLSLSLVCFNATRADASPTGRGAVLCCASVW